MSAWLGANTIGRDGSQYLDTTDVRHVCYIALFYLIG